MMPEASNLLVRQDGISRDRIKSIDRNAFLIIFAVALPVFVTLMLQKLRGRPELAEEK